MLGAPAPSQAAIDTIFDVFPAEPLEGDEVIVGDVALGYLSITEGSLLVSNDVIIGNEEEAIGFATVIDFLSEWSTLDLTVGESGIGRLEILNGALVDVDYLGGVGDLVIGRDAGSNGEILVNGFQTILSMGDNTTVGLNGTGLLRIENEAFVDATNSPGSPSDIFTVGSDGRVELVDGWLRTGTLINHGAIVGAGRIDSATTIENNGRIETVSGERLVVANSVTNRSEISIFGGEIEFRGSVENSDLGASLTLLNGIVRFEESPGGFENRTGVLAMTGGTNDLFGPVANLGGTIVVGGKSTAVFHDEVDNQGGHIEVFPGSTALFLADLTMNANSSLAVRLTSTAEQVEAGAVEIAGSATLAGDLAIELDPGFVPQAGDAFAILGAAGGLEGSFNLAAPDLPSGLQWQLDTLGASRLVLSVVAPELAGDYNANGIVDAADYTLWRDSLGQSGTGLAADGNNDGIIDDADYDLWKGRFGATAGASSTTAPAAPVPEPATWVMLLGATALVLGRSATGRLTSRVDLQNDRWRAG